MLGNLLLTSKWAQAAELACAFLIPAVFLAILHTLEDPSPLTAHLLIAASIVVMIGVVWLGLRLRAQPWSHLGLTFSRCGRRTAMRAVLKSLVVFIAALAAFVIGTIVMQSLAGDREGADLSAYDHLQGNLPLLLLTLASVYLTASFGEEVLYRGFLMTRLAELFGGGKAAWLMALGMSSLVFGLIHYQWGPIGMVQTAFMGLALGISYLAVQRNLWVTILAHGYLDTLLILPLYFSRSN